MSPFLLSNIPTTERDNNFKLLICQIHIIFKEMWRFENRFTQIDGFCYLVTLPSNFNLWSSNAKFLTLKLMKGNKISFASRISYIIFNNLAKNIVDLTF